MKMDTGGASIYLESVDNSMIFNKYIRYETLFLS